MSNLPRESIEALSRAAVQQYGTQRQVSKAVEECAEFIVEVHHWRDGREGALDSLLGEIADVHIVMRQMREIFGEAVVEKEIQRKLVIFKEKMRADRAKSEKKKPVIGRSRLNENMADI